MSRFEIGIRAAARIVQPTGLNVRFDAAVPFVREVFFKPLRKGGQLRRGQLADRGFQFVQAHGNLRKGWRHSQYRAQTALRQGQPTFAQPEARPYQKVGQNPVQVKVITVTVLPADLNEPTDVIGIWPRRPAAFHLQQDDFKYVSAFEPIDAFVMIFPNGHDIDDAD